MPPNGNKKRYLYYKFKALEDLLSHGVAETPARKSLGLSYETHKAWTEEGKMQEIENEFGDLGNSFESSDEELNNQPTLTEDEALDALTDREKYLLVEKHRRDRSLDVEAACALVKIPRSTYYAQKAAAVGGGHNGEKMERKKGSGRPKKTYERIESLPLPVENPQPAPRPAPIATAPEKNDFELKGSPQSVAQFLFHMAENFKR